MSSEKLATTCNLAGCKFYTIKKMVSEKLLKIEKWQVRDVTTKIVICEFLCFPQSWLYMTKRLENICKSRGLNPKRFELHY